MKLLKNIILMPFLIISLPFMAIFLLVARALDLIEKEAEHESFLDAMAKLAK